MAKQHAYIRIDLKLKDTDITIPSAYAFHANVDCKHSNANIKAEITEIAMRNIAGLKSNEGICYSNMSCTNIHGKVFALDSSTHKIPDNVQEIKLELEVHEDFQFSKSKSIIKASGSHINNLMTFLGLNFISFSALCMAMPANTDSRITLFTGMILSSNIATIFLHPQKSRSDACRTALYNNVIGICAALVMELPYICAKKSYSSLDKEYGSLLCLAASVIAMQTLYDPVYGIEYSI